MIMPKHIGTGKADILGDAIDSHPSLLVIVHYFSYFHLFVDGLRLMKCPALLVWMDVGETEV